MNGKGTSPKASPKVDAQRAMREARWADAQARAAGQRPTDPPPPRKPRKPR